MAIIKDIEGRELYISCIACSIQSGEIQLPVERIAETEYFVIEQDFEYPIEGFLVLVSKRHIASSAEFSAEEARDFIDLLIKTRKALLSQGIKQVTLVQEETSKTSHFHVWFFPWHPWMLEQWKGKLEDIKPIMARAKAEMSNEAVLAKVRETTAKIKSIFSV